MELARRIDNAIYSRKALASAREAYRSYCTVSAVPGSDGLVTLCVVVRPEHQESGREVLLEFWNYFLDAECQRRLEQETD